MASGQIYIWWFFDFVFIFGGFFASQLSEIVTALGRKKSNVNLSFSNKNSFYCFCFLMRINNGMHSQFK